MARAKKATASTEQLQMEVDRIKEDDRAATVAALQASPAPAAHAPLMADREPAEPFARWLIQQAPQSDLA